MRIRLPQLAETVLDGFKTVGGVGRLEAYFGEVLREATTKQDYQSVGLRLALDTLVLQVIRSFSSSSDILPGSPAHPAVARTLHLLSSRFREPWTLELLAREVGVSRGRLAALFFHRDRINHPSNAT